MTCNTDDLVITDVPPHVCFVCRRQKPFIVVTFEGEGDMEAVEVIPSKWLTRNQKCCFFPTGSPFSNTKQIRDQVDADPSWDVFPVKIVAGSSKNSLSVWMRRVSVTM